MSVYPVLCAAEDGRGVVVTLVARAVAANTEKGEQDSGWFTGTLQGHAPLQGEQCPFRAPRTTWLASASLHWGYPGSSAL